MPDRKPFALANWKMAMTLDETRAFVARFLPLVADLAGRVDVVVCPPCTALRTLAEALRDTWVEVGVQNVHPGPDPAFTGEISPALAADAGARWALIGHWERRRHFGEDEAFLKAKVRAALEAGLRPILLVGEPRDVSPPNADALDAYLSQVLAGCTPTDVARMAFVYEPEGAIGRDEPLSPDRVGEGCRLVRAWLAARFGTVAARVPIIYGGSVTPEHAADLLRHPEVDGLGAGRRGRDPVAFAAIVRQIATLATQRGG